MAESPNKKPESDILLVEDNRGDALVIIQVVAELPFRATLQIAQDGAEALSMLSDLSFEPSLIILDLSLPLISGHIVLERNPRKNVPVVIFSASWNDVDLDRAFSLGAAEYVQKPMGLTAYKDAVRAMIEKWIVHEKDGTGH